MTTDRKMQVLNKTFQFERGCLYDEPKPANFDLSHVMPLHLKNIQMEAYTSQNLNNSPFKNKAEPRRIESEKFQQVLGDKRIKDQGLENYYVIYNNRNHMFVGIYCVIYQRINLTRLRSDSG